MIRVLIGQRGMLLRGAMATVLSRTPDITVVAEVSDADRVVRAVGREAVDVAILEAQLPGSISLPELCDKLIPHCRVLLVCDPAAPDSRWARLASLVPRIGFVATEASLQTLVDCVRQLARGEVVIDTTLALSFMVASHNPLSSREREVLLLAAEGLRSAEIAQRLFLSPGTVRNHLSRILAKTDARSRIAAIRTARERGWM